MWQFIKLLLASWLSKVLFLLGILSAVATYIPRLTLPAWIPPSILVVAVLVASYDVYRKQQREIERLRVRPYDEARRNLVERLITRLGPIERDLLRYLLHHQPLDRSHLLAASNLNENVFGESLTTLSRAGLAEFYADETRKYQYWRIRERFVEVLRDLLFPRQEEEEQQYFLT